MDECKVRALQVIIQKVMVTEVAACTSSLSYEGEITKTIRGETCECDTVQANFLLDWKMHISGYSAFEYPPAIYSLILL